MTYLVVQTKDDRYAHSYGTTWKEDSANLRVSDPEGYDTAYPIEEVRWWQEVDSQRGYLGEVHYPEGSDPEKTDDQRAIDELLREVNSGDHGGTAA